MTGPGPAIEVVVPNPEFARAVLRVLGADEATIDHRIEASRRRDAR